MLIYIKVNDLAFCFVFQMYYLEEFESLVDELLFRLNAFSNSLHHTPPHKAHRYREDDGSAISLREEPSDLDIQVSWPHVQHANTTFFCTQYIFSFFFFFFTKGVFNVTLWPLQDFIRARMTEERKSDLTDVSGHGKTLSASLLIR